MQTFSSFSGQPLPSFPYPLNVTVFGYGVIPPSQKPMFMALSPQSHKSMIMSLTPLTHKPMIMALSPCPTNQWLWYYLTCPTNQWLRRYPPCPTNQWLWCYPPCPTNQWLRRYPPSPTNQWLWCYRPCPTNQWLWRYPLVPQTNDYKWCSVKECCPSHSKMKCLWQSLLGLALLVLSSMKMVLYELKIKVDWYLLYRCLKLTSLRMLLVTCDNINYLGVCTIFEK